MEPTLYWHDYETFGTRPSLDRPSQFAGLRTNLNLEEIGEPLMIYSQLADDSLPVPKACLVTGILPNKTHSDGLCEAEFIRQIRAEFMQPNTCGVGYNSLRFDDEVTRFTLYRNLYDAYEREYINQNSRWDIIDMVRLTWATRPEGIQWPKDENGKVSFRLEKLTEANGIAHVGAHDALADVRATLALARLVRQHQPRLYEFCFQNRRKNAVQSQLKKFDREPFLHVSAFYSVQTEGGIAPVVVLGNVPGRPNDYLVYNLRNCPKQFVGFSVDELRERLFVPEDQRPAHWVRPPIKSIRINQCPVIAPTTVLSAQRAQELGIDWSVVKRNHQNLLSCPELCRSFIDIFASEAPTAQTAQKLDSIDPDQNLYSGGFPSAGDKRWTNRFLKTPIENWRKLEEELEIKGGGDDPWLGERVFRCRARSFPETLDATERQRWAKHCHNRLTQGKHGITPYHEWRTNVQELLVETASSSAKEVLQQLLIYGEQLAQKWNLLQ